jgi:uncharacterized protein
VRYVRLALVLALLAGLGYTAYVAYEGSRQMVALPRDRVADCRTPDLVYGWAYEAINYDQADDATLAAFPDRMACPDQGSMAGGAVVAADGTPIAGWYVPAELDAGSPTVVMVHGHGATKSAMLVHAAALHRDFNLVFIDLRNGGRSGGTQTTMGLREKDDLRAIIDWVERETGARRIGVLGDSMGAATALALAGEDGRIDALVLDSVHRSLEDNVARRLPANGHPSYPGTWAILLGARIRTGSDLSQVDPIGTITRYGDRPVLFVHGTADAEDLPSALEDLVDAARAAGTPARIEWCEGATHGQVAATCPDAYGEWVSAFFNDALGAGDDTAVLPPGRIGTVAP